MMPDRSARARGSVASGASSEWMALGALALKGYRPLARRFGGKGGEIDLIVKRGRTIAFVEVKARARLDDAVIAITPAKLALMQRRIGDWRARNPWAAGCVLRIDAVFVARGRWPRHVAAVAPLDLP
jgi:putative endonuclease